MVSKVFALSLLGSAIAQSSSSAPQTSSAPSIASATSQATPSVTARQSASLNPKYSTGLRPPTITSTRTGPSSVVTFPAVLFESYKNATFILYASAINVAPQATTILVGCMSDSESDTDTDTDDDNEYTDDTDSDSSDDEGCPFYESQTLIFGPSTYGTVATYKWPASEYADYDTDGWATSMSVGCNIAGGKATCATTEAGKVYSATGTMTVEAAGVAPITVTVTDGLNKMGSTANAQLVRTGNAAASNTVMKGAAMGGVVVSLLGSLFL